MLKTNSRDWLVTLGGGVVIGVVLLLMLAFLPPFSLVARLGNGSYTSLSPDNPAVSHQDGVHVVVVRPDELDGGFSVELDSVPRLNFLEGSAGSGLKRAAEALPAHLLVKSPYYKISTRGDAPDSTTIVVDIPNDAKPWETLDLYTWTGAGWEWVGAQVDVDSARILAQVGPDVPESVVAMQVDSAPPAILVELPQGQAPSGVAASGATHVLLSGMSLGGRGGLVGDQARLPIPTTGDSFSLMPSLRNWSRETGQVNQAALADLLADPIARQAHIDSIIALVVAQGYAGLDLDYRGVSVDWRDAYTSFVADLASALHSSGKLLTVAVEAATPTASGGWDTGGYNWRALGQLADAVRVPLPSGDVEGYLNWAVSQISRRKLLPAFSAFSRDEAGGRVSYIALKEALAPLGDVTGPDGSVLSPGEIVKVDLGGEALSTLQHDQGGQTYSYTYHDAQGVAHRVTVATAASLGKMLELASRYHLGGVYVDGISVPGGDPALSEAVRQFAARAPAATNGVLQVIWTVEAADGGQVAREDRPLGENDSFEWAAPDTAGEYVIGAAVSSQTGVQGAKQGGVSVRVETAPPTPEPTATPDPEAAPEPGARANASEVTAFSADCLNSVYVADVTVADNTRFEKSESFKKTWRVQNNGSCPWPQDAKLVFVGGDQLSAPGNVEVGTLAVGGTTEISVDMAAPDGDGDYKGIWRLADGSGTPFGTQLTVVIKVGQEPAVVNPAPLPSGGFELGGHYRTWNYVGQMKSAAMTWAKTQVHFGQDATGIVAAAHNNGFKIQLSALGTPGMVVEPDFHAKYTAWVANLARAGADAIEVWNEPNIEREWQLGQISPEAYTQLLCASYSAIKAANPGTAVISAAPAPTGFFGGCGGNGCDDLPWLQRMYNAGAANCMDYIGAHHNSGATSPSARSGHPADNGGGHHSWYFLPQTELYYNTFGGARKLFYTEMGYASQEGLPTFSDMFGWARGTNNAQQAAWLAEAVRLSRSTGMVSNIIVWNIDFVRYGYDPQDGYAIIRPGGACPACESLRAAMQ